MKDIHFKYYFLIRSVVMKPKQITLDATIHTFVGSIIGAVGSM